jgi:ribosomal protein S18 acetylase RimI-like enzyme
MSGCLKRQPRFHTGRFFMKIRRMRIGDYEAVYRLWIATSGMGLNTADDSREGIAAYLRRNPKTCFVAEENGEVIGAILSGHDGRRGYIYHTAVSIKHRNRGTGFALVEQAMESLKREGIHKVALMVFGKNEVGNAFWDKCGFTVRNDLIYRNKNISQLTRVDT